MDLLDFHIREKQTSCNLTADRSHWHAITSNEIHGSDILPRYLAQSDQDKHHFLRRKLYYQFICELQVTCRSVNTFELLVKSTKVLKVGGIQITQDFRQAVFLAASPTRRLTPREQNRLQRRL